MARKASDSVTMRKPVHDRWYYDQVPVLAAQQSVSEDESNDAISSLAGSVSTQLTVNGESQSGCLTIKRTLMNGESFITNQSTLMNGESFITNQSQEFTQVPELTFTFLDWVSEHHRHPFTVVLEFPNAIDPDHPMDTVEDQEMEVFVNQKVPNLYLQISNIIRVFPSCLLLMVSGNVLRHTYRTHFGGRM